MSWTDDRVATLKKMWKEGHSAADIAKTLGKGVTRNAVIGKAHRMGLSGRPSPIKGTPVTTKPAKTSKVEDKKKVTAVKGKSASETKQKANEEDAKAKASKGKVKGAKETVIEASKAAKNAKQSKEEFIIANIPTDVPPPDGGVALIDLTERMCRWPFGDPREEGFTFCGRPAYPGKPYCADHVLVAYQSSSRARAAAKAREAAAEEDLEVDIEDVVNADDVDVDEDEVGNVD